jgi:hypothetical protein
VSDTIEKIEKAQRYTAASLNHLIQTTEELTQFQLDEITELVNEVSRLLPAGNVVQMVFSQLRSVKGRRVSSKDSRRLMGLLQQGMSTFLDKMAYMTFYTTPAILISGYQVLLRAAGKDPNEAFPNGTWQYYLEFGLREDTGRHACETVGFKHSIDSQRLRVSEADQLAAWIMAAASTLIDYDNLLFQEWQERIFLRRLGERLNDSHIMSRWLKRRPYGVPPTVDQSYITYRRETFAEFIRDMLGKELKPEQVDETVAFWGEEQTLSGDDRFGYQRQMSLLAALEPSVFNDTRVPLSIEDSYVAIIWNGLYHLIPVTHNHVQLDQLTMRAFAQAILNNRQRRIGDALDELIIAIPRGDQKNVREQLPSSSQGQIAKLRKAPIVINWERVNSTLPLAEIRRGRRGIGDHALTLFRTSDSMVFDQSHIFFDATWGMACAEIITSHAIRYIETMHNLEPIEMPRLKPSFLDFTIPRQLSNSLSKSGVPMHELNAEVELPTIVEEMNQLRRLMSKRNRKLRLTINDFLVLFRALFNQYYRPSKTLIETLTLLEAGSKRQRQVVHDVRELLYEISQTMPAFLIPIDASIINPRDRVFPVTFAPAPPWTEIGPFHEETWSLYKAYQKQPNEARWKTFSESRTRYLEMLWMFGLLMERYKEIALEGKSFSTATLKILGSVPKRLQTMLRDIPDRIDVLNDMLKGTEVFSNAGRVSDESSLVRFITAKDDNRKKELCWGIMTRADGVMVISLRDFRPQLTALLDVGAADTAHDITRDFLEGYKSGLQSYIRELHEMVKIRKAHS